MKNFKSLAQILVMVVCLPMLIISCRKDGDALDENLHKTNSQSLVEDGAVAKSGFTEYQVNPKFGKPNSTNFVFRVSDPIGANALSVKFFERATGVVNYIPMVRVGSEWQLTKQMINNGWFDYRYVYTGSNANISTNSYELCATYNTFNETGTSSIYWPFGADGSSWSNKIGYADGVAQQWLRGNAGGGYDHNQGTHTGTTERYAVDWNRRKLVGWSTNDDLGAEFKSPFDGEILDFGTYPTSCCGLSQYVSVLQEASDGKLYKFFIGHLQSYPTYFQKKTSTQKGTPTKAGYTVLGWIGSSGATSPHAHCSMRRYSSETSVMFEFDAN